MNIYFILNILTFILSMFNAIYVIKSIKFRFELIKKKKDYFMAYKGTDEFRDITNDIKYLLISLSVSVVLMIMSGILAYMTK